MRRVPMLQNLYSNNKPKSEPHVAFQISSPDAIYLRRFISKMTHLSLFLVISSIRY
jgi:hypothetical protein